ncbi:MAG: hypothetical protein CTY17_06870 [Methylomonas sp.]|nr:MAG: hypothetical protein CTY21_08335 [Methylomonas sp.]PPD40241.1 MAG: hypothetical protein CTY17_06870 [Methylomonas sp.]PPD55339.1 MAG: hypothetical protein CTY11_01725 [Methylomonas sp.]
MVVISFAHQISLALCSQEEGRAGNNKLRNLMRNNLKARICNMSKQASPDIDVVISLDESHFSQFTSISKQLSSSGLKDIQIMKSIGIITGKCEPASMANMQCISGVAAIEVAGHVQIAPPESDIQ